MLIVCAAAGGLLRMLLLPPVVDALCVGLCGACNRVALVGGISCRGCGVGASTGILHRFRDGVRRGGRAASLRGIVSAAGRPSWLLWGAVTVSEAGLWSFLVQLRGLSEGMKKRPGRYASALCLMGLLVKCRRFTFQWSISRRCSSSGITGRLL